MKNIQHSLLAIFSVIFLDMTPAKAVNVIDSDDRVDTPPNTHPYKTVGRLVLPGVKHCTATLVGPNLILTNVHCIADNNVSPSTAIEPNRFVFYPDYPHSKKSSKTIKAWSNIIDHRSASFDDWAILSLEKPLGDSFGWLPVTDIDMLDASLVESPQVDYVGYSGDWKKGLTASLHKGCLIKTYIYKYWRHNCDMTSGGSGGPLIYQDPLSGEFTIVAINSAERRDEGALKSMQNVPFETNPNTSVLAKRFAVKIQEINQELELGNGP